MQVAVGEYVLVPWAEWAEMCDGQGMERELSFESGDFPDGARVTISHYMDFYDDDEDSPTFDQWQSAYTFTEVA